jgi:plasmid stability protein
MAQLIVRNLPEVVVRRLKVRAASHGRSAEAEHRAILEGALGSDRPSKTLKESLLSIPRFGDDVDFARLRRKPRRVAL